MLFCYFFVFSSQLHENEGNWPKITPRQTWPTDSPSWPPSFTKIIRYSTQNTIQNHVNYVRPISMFGIFFILSLFVIVSTCVIHHNKHNKLGRKNNISFSIGEDLRLMEDISENSPPHPKTEL